MCVVYLVDSGFVLPWDLLWDSNNEFLRTFRQTRLRSKSSGKRGRRSSPRERKHTKKIMAFRKRRYYRGPHALEVTNLNAVASNLPRTCFKSKYLPNLVIFITELHFCVFLTLCSSSNSGKSLWTWRKTWEARTTRSSLNHKNYISNCRD